MIMQLKNSAQYISWYKITLIVLTFILKTAFFIATKMRYVIGQLSFSNSHPKAMPKFESNISPNFFEIDSSV